jgi:hypothetical protein
MKTLLERLKPEVKEIFDVEAKKYPTTVKFIMGHLDQTSWVGELKSSVVEDIASIEGIREYFGVDYSDMYLASNFNQMFDQESI